MASRWYIISIDDKHQESLMDSVFGTYEQAKSRANLMGCDLALTPMKYVIRLSPPRRFEGGVYVTFNND